ncbi:hypothetical protein ACOMHN_061122 [Nucella lapillus]
MLLLHMLRATMMMTTTTMMMMMMLMTMTMMWHGVYGHTTCSAVSMRQVTTVTCLFDKDISNNDFNVFYFPTPQSQSDMVLACNRQKTGGLICDVGKDVKFSQDQTVSSELILARPSPVNTAPGGQYVCQALTGSNEPVQRCNVTFTSLPSLPPVTPHILPQGNNGDDSDHLGAVAVFFLLLIIIAVIVVCVLFYICRERIRKWCSGPIRQNWPGATGDPEELETAVKASAVEEGGSQGESLLAGDSPEDSVLQEIPQGLPQFFFKKGWTDGKARAEREMEAKNALAQGQRQKNKDMQGTTAQEAADQTQSLSFWQRNSWIPGSTRKEEKRQQTKEPNPKSHGTEGRQGNPFVKRYEEEDDFVDASQGDTDLQHLGASHPPVNVPIASEAIYVLDTAGQRGSQTESKKEKKARKDKEQKEKKAKEKEKKEKEKKEKEEKKAEEDRLKAEAKAAKQKK